jgi:hypothetical protein
MTTETFLTVLLVLLGMTLFNSALRRRGYRPGPRLVAAQRWTRRHPWKAGMVVGLIIGLLFGILYALTDDIGTGLLAAVAFFALLTAIVGGLGRMANPPSDSSGGIDPDSES